MKLHRLHCALWLLAAACGAPGYVPLAEASLAAISEPTTYVLDTGDVLEIAVVGQEASKARTLVRPDGRVSFPLVGELRAAGLTIAELTAKLTEALRKYLNGPVVHVALAEARPATITILGEVSRPGVYPLGRSMNVAKALATAGGLTDFANRSRILVSRQKPALKLRFTWQDLAAQTPQAQAFLLSDGDVIVVE